MTRLDLVCSACGHTFHLEAVTVLKDDEKRCPECGATATRQTFVSYLRNGPLLDPDWGQTRGRSGFG
jgi:putative FmdB family regulatory protein